MTGKVLSPGMRVGSPRTSPRSRTKSSSHAMYSVALRRTRTYGGRLNRCVSASAAKSARKESGGRPSLLSRKADILAFEQESEIVRHQKRTGHVDYRVMKLSKGYEVTVTSTLDEPGVVLHWGLAPRGCEEHMWFTPKESLRPAGTVPYNNDAVETTMTEREGKHETTLFFPRKEAPTAVNFVLKDASGRWYNNGGCGWRVQIAKQPLTTVKDAHAIISSVDGTTMLTNFFSIFSESSVAHSKGDEEVSRCSCRVDYMVSTNHRLTTHLVISQDGRNVMLNVSTDLPGSPCFHWGVVPRGFDSSAWALPQRTSWPLNSVKHKDDAVRSPMSRDKSDGWAKISINAGLEPQAIKFVIHDPETDEWHDNHGTNYYVPMPDVVVDLQSPVLPPFSIALQNRENEKKKARKSNFLSNQSSKDHYLNTIDSQHDSHTEEHYGTESSISGFGPSTNEGIRESSPIEGLELYEAFETDHKWRIVLPSPHALPGTRRKVEIAPYHHSGTGHGSEILLQGFNWESCHQDNGNFYSVLRSLGKEIKEAGFSMVWFPPPTDSVSPQGYMPRDLYNLSSRYGSATELRRTLAHYRKLGIHVLCDAVLNHRCAHEKDSNGVYNKFGGKLKWDSRAIVSDDPNFRGTGHRSSGECFHAAPNIDHCQDFVKSDIKEWMQWLKDDVGFSGWRLDFVRGFWGGHVREYIEKTQPFFSVGEFWDSLSYTHGSLDYVQDSHRQRTVNWINATKSLSAAFDVTTKGILHSVFNNNEYWRLVDKHGKPPGLMGWWPSRAVTFLENHDTGSTQNHWPFPRHCILQGYCYILTHPGTPCVFFDHMFNSGDEVKDKIRHLILARREAGLYCRSAVKILRADSQCYAAEVGDNLCMKIGPDGWAPNSAHWKLFTNGHEYAVWLRR